MSRGLRVLFVNAGGILGGAEHSLLLLLRAIRESGVESTVALLEDGPLRERLTRDGVPTFVMSLPDAVRRAGRYRAAFHPLHTGKLVALGLPTAWRLARLARRCAADLIHSNGMKAQLLGGLAGRMARVPVVWHVRDFPPPGWAGRIFRRQARWLPSIVLANSESVRSAVMDGRTGGPPVLAVRNPVDLEAFGPHVARGRFRRELGLDETVPLVGLIAHLTPWKGHARFLEIARRVAGLVPSARFVVVGGPVYATDGHQGYAQELHTQAATLGLCDRVAFLGARADIADVVTDLDLLVHCPTAPEPFGRVIAEAMAAGRPVVAANAGGIPELVEHGTTGLLVPPDDVNGFAAGTVGLLNDPQLRRAMGKAGRRRAETMFRIDAHADAVLSAYQHVLGTPSRGLDRVVE
jgi:glycosyltransferase involved in cell wall biosynthesis